ncbi:hypothetical protein AVEN_197219-1 [Araneus ventricosus]|uniref:Uncharacterized protein n=1 Tax=Araneus ventricosus TaxID=182803 RepID=A0A4Y2GH36_ARAVE|nr:hypothetical protein AVEN_197219-1 [Araneus ventricosus]
MTFVKLRSYGLSFCELQPWFALFLFVRTGRIDVDRGLVNTSVVSRVMTVNSSHIKGRGWPDGVSASVHSSAGERFPNLSAVETARMFEIPPTTFRKYEARSNRGLPSHKSSEEGFMWF